MVDATRYAWDRCYDLLFPASNLALQYKMVEDLYALLRENIPKETKTRQM